MRPMKSERKPKFTKKPLRPRKPRPNLFKDDKIDYKNIDLIQKGVTPSGKIMSRRFTGANHRQQRDLTKALKRAKYLALLPVGSTKRF